jgi:hypothetical protein
MPMINADRHHISVVLYTSDSITSNRPSNRARVNGCKRSGNTIGWLCHHSLCSGPLTAPIILTIIFYRNKVPSLVRCGLQNISNSRTFRLLDPASVSRGQLKQKDILFYQKMNRHTIICCTYKTGHYCVHTISITFAFCFTVSFSFSLHGQHLCPPSYFSQRSVDQRR